MNWRKRDASKRNVGRLSLCRTKDYAPDGRPLYAYKCNNEDYQRFEIRVRETMPKVLKGYFEPSFGALFCIYAAESWRRKHEGGHWKWETVFSNILDSDPRHAIIVNWVKDGLAYWKRPVLKSRIGHNEYLVTIACEGGLPLLLLRKENAHLKHYFKNLLESYHRERHRPNCNATEIAQRLSAILPRTLRQDIVFNLGGDLVKKIVDLQEEVADAVNPIRLWINPVKTGGDRLPLPLEDGTVELLLKNLVQEARELSVTEQQRVRWRGLIRIGGQLPSRSDSICRKFFPDRSYNAGVTGQICHENESLDPDG